MDNPRPEKVAVVDEVKSRIQESDATLLTEYRGLTVKDLADLRGQLRGSGADYKIYKNTLVRFAVRDLDLTDLEESLTGPTAIAFIKGDAAAVAKALREFAKTNPNLIVKGGVLGTKILTAKDAAALADLPPRDVVLAQLAGLLAQPMQQFAGLLQALPRNMAYGLKALVEKKVAGGESLPAVEPEKEAPAEEPATADSPVVETAATEEPAVAETETTETPTPESETTGDN
jgi:large subunit ribosomal protein L10